MPTYEYLCQTCSHRFEQWQKMADEALTICPVCGSHIRRVFYPAGIVFKGSGFYKTDHNTSSSTADTADSNGNGHAPKHESEHAAETKTSSESKPAESTASSTPTNENTAPASAGTK